MLMTSISRLNELSFSSEGYVFADSSGSRSGSGNTTLTTTSDLLSSTVACHTPPYAPFPILPATCVCFPQAITSSGSHSYSYFFNVALFLTNLLKHTLLHVLTQKKCRAHEKALQRMYIRGDFRCIHHRARVIRDGGQQFTTSRSARLYRLSFARPRFTRSGELES